MAEMKRFAFFALLFLAAPAWAEEPVVLSPADQIEALQKQVDFLKTALDTVRGQRDQVSSALQDALANAAGLKAQADAAAIRAKPKDAKP